MSDISKIRIQSGEYNIKDAQAREDITEIQNQLYVIHLNEQTEDEIQAIFELDKPKYIVLDNNITFTKTIRLNRNTTIDLNGKTINFNLPSVVDDPTLSHGFFNFKSSDTIVTKYNGEGNIHIMNGTISGGNCSFIHGQNVTFTSVNFLNSWNDHILELCAMKDVKIDGCTFAGVPAGANANAEMVQLDACSYGNFPWLDEDSDAYDGTPNENISVTNSQFIQSSNANFQSSKGFGSHSQNANEFHKNIIVKNCTFNLSYCGIELRNVKKAVIDHCNFDITHDTNETFKLRLRYTTDDIIITNNVFNGSGYAILKQDAYGNTGVISNNVFMNCKNTAGYPIVSYVGKNIIISDNVFTDYTQRCIAITPVSTSSSSEGSYNISNNMFRPNDEAALSDNAINIQDGITIAEDNTFDYNNLPSNQVIVIRSDYTSLTDAIIRSNFFNDTLKVNPSKCVYATNARGYNNVYDVLFKVGDYNSTSFSGQSTDWDFTKFNTCVVILGDGNHAQPHQFKQFNQNEKLDNRTYLFNGVDKSNNNATVNTFSIVNGNSFSYSSTGDTPIRTIYVMNQ